MNEQEFIQKMKNGEIERIGEKPEITIEPIREEPLNDLDQYRQVLEIARQLQQPETSTPTDKPQNFLQQIRTYLSGTTYRVYFNINKVWTKIYDSTWGVPIKGDGTAGRVLRIARLVIQNGTAASSLKCTLYNVWNGDAIAVTDNIVKDATTGNFTLDSTGHNLTIEAAGLSGNVLGGLSMVGYNNAGESLASDLTIVANDIRLKIYDLPGSSSNDFTVLVDTGDIYIDILYITDA